MSINVEEARELIKKYRSVKGSLIPLLQQIQSVYGYVPREVIELIAKEYSIYPVEIYGVLTFYSQFHLTPRGKHTIRVCQGTACHVMGGKDILDYLVEVLRIKVGETSADGMFSLERVACLGCCGIAPVVAIDDDFYGNCSIEMIGSLLDKYREKVK